MKFKHLLYAVIILFATLVLVMSLMKKRKESILKDVVVYKTEKLNALVDTVKGLISTVETEKQKIEDLKGHEAETMEKRAPCRCEPKKRTTIPPGKYVIASVAPVIYSPENTCHPKPSGIGLELNFSDSSTLGAQHIQMILSNADAVMTGACFKTVTGKIGFTVERYTLQCAASLAGPSGQDKLPVKQIRIDLKPQVSLQYQLKLLVRIDCDDITGAIELYQRGQLTNSARFKMTHVPD